MLKNFRTYQLAVNLYRECQSVKVPHYLKDQLLRASLSVVLNLAEGSAKPTPRDRARFYAIAMGSLREVQAVLDLVRAETVIQHADCLGAHLYRLTHPKQLPVPEPAP